MTILSNFIWDDYYLFLQQMLQKPFFFFTKKEFNLHEMVAISKAVIFLR